MRPAARHVHSADGWRAVLEPVVRPLPGVKRLYFRGDAAFANPEMSSFSKPRGIGYTIRLPANPHLAGQIDTPTPVARPDAAALTNAATPALH